LQSKGLAYKELSICSDLFLSMLSALFFEERCALLCAPPQLERGVSVQCTELFLPPDRSLLDGACERYGCALQQQES